MENYMPLISSIIYPVVPNDTQRVITEDCLECPHSNSVEQHIEKYIKSQNTDIPVVDSF